MKIVTAPQMREIDRITMEERGIPGIALMRQAGVAVARAALDFFEPDSVAIVTGKGNNAGDGFVAARELHRRGVDVAVFALEEPDNLKGDAAQAYAEFAAARLRDAAGPEAECRPSEYIRPALADFARLAPQYDLIIDALLGTGLNRPVTGEWAEWIAAMNAIDRPLLAIDIPSGLPAEPLSTAEAESRAIIRATRTVTIGRPKIGMVLGAGVLCTGTVTIEEIQFPVDLLENPAISTNLMTPAEARQLLPPRNPAGNKGTFGKVLIIAGSAGMTGAAVLCARAAARSGAGLVYVAYPEPLGANIESHLIEPVKLPLPGASPWFGPEHLEPLLARLPEMDAVALGPGLGTRPATEEFFRLLLPRIEAPLVLDADGLNLLAKMPDLLRERQAGVILTPHPGEAARLLGLGIGEVEADRLNAFTGFCARQQCTCVLKGAQSLITTADGARWVNPTGNSGLAKGGSGDVLTGLLAGLLAQGMPEPEAARLGVWLHGLAGDLVAERIGPRAMLPGDVIESLGPAFRVIERGLAPGEI